MIVASGKTSISSMPGKATVIIFTMDIARLGRTIAFKSSAIIILRESSGMAQDCG
jgi:hypothetical protein